MISWWQWAALACIAMGAFAAMVPDGTVVRVGRIIDGDGVQSRGGQAYRLHGVDAPELCQPWGGEGAARASRCPRSWRGDGVAGRAALHAPGGRCRGGTSGMYPGPGNGLYWR